jgi:hypothetical protein
LQSFQGLSVGVYCWLKGFDGFAISEDSSHELFETDGFVFICFVDMPVDGLTGLIFAL